ncbi:ArsR/SmtB family transcription factor, partial [Tepidibacillus decaturensis]|uniref:ArsR/SmtB family transcription factor n=1 Tax=Tepidibacillus decaturensis TaxID=1413211 RepID=UPI0008388259
MENPHFSELEEIAELLKILGDKTRLTLFSLLKARELCVCELTELLDVSQPAISQHLRKLKLLNLVKERKQGQWVYYSLRKPNEDETMLQTVIEHLPDLTEWLTSLKMGQSCNFPLNEDTKN